MIEQKSISEPELVKRWNMNPATFFFRKVNNQIPKHHLRNMMTYYFMDDVLSYEVANGIVATSSTER